jgi:quercetin dioxygenase-like cupin family protein
VGIYGTDNYKVIITYIKAGQFIPVHSPSTDLIFAVFTGTGTAFAGNREVPLNPGSILVVPGGEKRGIRAERDMEALHLVSPVPDDSDHTEVMKKLLKNSYL